MNSSILADPLAHWLRAARAGSRDDLGRALDACRDYLLLVAHAEIGSTLRPKAGPSDVVQDSLLDAQAGFEQFRGTTRDELQAWLLQILRNNITDVARKYRDAARRAVDRELPLDLVPPSRLTAAGGTSPSEVAARADETARLRAAVARLPVEARLVLGLRQFDRLEWSEIGTRLGKTPEAARKVWFRAVERLRLELGPTDAA